MKRETMFNGIGLLLLVGMFSFSLFRIWRRDHREDDARMTVRFAHWQLEGKIRSAFDVVARDYEKTHPGIRIEQIPIPERVYAQWLRTQLVGETAPDILQLGMIGSMDEVLARFFVPLTEEVDRPNPYNRGTDLEATPWRDTFVDGLAAGFNYRPNLLDYYGVSMSLHTVRVFYNATLWREILGDTPIPASYGEFIAACDRVSAYAKETGRPVVPIASSKANGFLLINRIAASQTQRLAMDITRRGTLKHTSADICMGYLEGDWTLAAKAITDSLEIEREIGRRMQGGFMQMAREDASFYFVQGRALFITAGSWDAPSFRMQISFDMGVFGVPVPARDHPRYGGNVLGPASEADVNTGLSLGITRGSKNKEAALDFLRYLTSRKANARFSDLSGWLPSVTGIDVSEEVRPFVPLIDTGYINGFTLRQLGSDTARLVETHYHRLFGPDGSVTAFKESIAPGLTDAVKADLGRQSRVMFASIARQDLLFAANLMLVRHAQEPGTPSVAESARKLSAIIEAQNEQEATHAWLKSIEPVRHP